MSKSRYTTYDRNSVTDDIDERDDLVIDFKIANSIIINDIILIKKHFENDNFYVKKNSTLNNFCYVKIRNDIPNIKLAKSNITDYIKNNRTNITISNNKKINSRIKTYPRLNIDKNINNSIIYNKTSYKIKNMSLLDVDYSHLDLLTQYFKHINYLEKEKLCNSCLNLVKILKFLENEIKEIKKDILKFVNKTVSKQDLVAKLSDQINKMNIIKINLFDLQPSLDLMKSINCTNLQENQNKFNSTLKLATGLVESLQNSIRKSNLNTNFLIISKN